MCAKRLFVGLGNPGRAYAGHRHNLGFMTLDKLAADENGRWAANREKDQVCEVGVEGVDLLLLKPQTYMNLSGKAVSGVLKKVGNDLPGIVVIHDDLDLAAGAVRIKVGGGDGGHRGVRSIANSLRFRDFVRVRLGIGRPPEGMTPEEYVLTDFVGEERRLRDELIDVGCRALRMLLSEGIEKTRNTFHALKNMPKAADG